MTPDEAPLDLAEVLLVAVYLVAIVAANLSVATFGPGVTVVSGISRGSRSDWRRSSACSPPHPMSWGMRRQRWPSRLRCSRRSATSATAWLWSPRTASKACRCRGMTSTHCSSACGNSEWDTLYHCRKPQGHSVAGPGLTDLRRMTPAEVNRFLRTIGASFRVADPQPEALTAKLQERGT